MQQKQNFWDAFADGYEKQAEMNTIQGALCLATMVNMRNAKKTIEVGCGPGKHSLMLASNIMPIGSVLVSTDFSGNMMNKLRNNYADKNNDYPLIEGNKSLFDMTNGNFDKKYDIDQIISEQGTFRKFVFGCQANNEFLPFSDGAFDAYIANVSLQLVDDHKKMLQEAFRVI